MCLSRARAVDAFHHEHGVRQLPAQVDSLETLGMYLERLTSYELGQVAQPLHASVSSSVKWG